MRRVSFNKLLIVALAIPLAMSLLLSDGRGQGDEKAKGDQPAAEKKERAQPAGRLPNYYSTVVSPEQREKIYGIQGKYADQIKKLQEQLTALEVQRDAEVEGVLTPEQKDKVAKLANDAKAKAKTKKEGEKKPEPAKTGDN
jgi:hypothetical protein